MKIMISKLMEKEFQDVENVTKSVAFGVSDYDHQLLKMVDAHIERNLNQLRKVRRSEEQDKITVKQLQGIEKLYNDEDFCPQLVGILPNRIQILHICRIDSSVLIYQRTVIVLKSNWIGLK